MDLLRSRRSQHLQSAAVAASRTLAILRSVPYGYSNTFHMRAFDDLPPTYNETREPKLEPEAVPLPAYTCTLSQQDSVDVMMEFEDPFKDMYQDSRWRTFTADLQGTKLSFYSARKHKLLYEFSLQHGEVGLAVDLRQGAPVPRSPLLELLPSNLRAKLYETKPHLFEPIRVWCVRLRLEGRQFLMSYQSESLMLDWVELLCAGIDISAPIEDRSMPKYRSLPRRSRRQRQLENASNDDAMVGTNDLESLTRQLIRQQQRILNSLYPDLGGTQTEADSQNSAGDVGGLSTQSTRAPTGPTNELERVVTNSNDPDMDDLDAADVLDYSTERPGFTPTTSHGTTRFNFDAPPPTSYDPKSASHDNNSAHARGNSLRYRRRCAPIMNKFSPWASDVIFVHGTRLRMDRKRGKFTKFEMAPPKYSSLVKAGVVSPAMAAMGAEAAVTSGKNDDAAAGSLAGSTAMTPTTTTMSGVDDDRTTILPVRLAGTTSNTEVLKRAVVTVVDMEGYAATGL